MNFFRKLKQRLQLGFSVTDPLSERGRKILSENWNAGYTIVDAVLNTKEQQKEDPRMIAKKNPFRKRIESEYNTNRS